MIKMIFWCENENFEMKLEIYKRFLQKCFCPKLFFATNKQRLLQPWKIIILMATIMKTHHLASSTSVPHKSFRSGSRPGGEKSGDNYEDGKWSWQSWQQWRWRWSWTLWIYLPARSSSVSLIARTPRASSSWGDDDDFDDDGEDVHVDDDDDDDFDFDDDEDVDVDDDFKYDDRNDNCTNTPSKQQLRRWIWDDDFDRCDEYVDVDDDFKWDDNCDDNLQDLPIVARLGTMMMMMISIKMMLMMISKTCR